MHCIALPYAARSLDLVNQEILALRCQGVVGKTVMKSLPGAVGKRSTAKSVPLMRKYVVPDRRLFCRRNTDYPGCSQIDPSLR